MAIMVTEEACGNIPMSDEDADADADGRQNWRQRTALTKLNVLVL